MLLKWLILDVNIDIKSQAYSCDFHAIFHIYIQLIYVKIFQYLFFLKVYASYILTRHPLCVLADNFIFCSIPGLNTLGQL